MKISDYFVAGALFLLSCQQAPAGRDKQPVVSGIENFNKYKKEFDILEVRRLNLGNTRNSHLFFYENSCRFSYHKDSILSVNGYVVRFSDSSNTSIDVVNFSSESYAASVAKQLDPFVVTVRKLKGNRENNDFCLPYYASRVYNYAVKENRLYLFAYDAYNITSETITAENLRYIDKMAGALQNPY